MKSIAIKSALIGLFVFAAAISIMNRVVAANSKQPADTPTIPQENQQKTENIIVAGGCFWCVESDFEAVDGVISATSGYINGDTPNPSYKQVSSQKTGHYEVVKIEFNPTVVTAKQLVDYFWLTIDPTDDGGQFCDRGSPYKTGLFYQTPQQKRLFTQSLEQIKQDKPFTADIVTPVLKAQTFYPAEDYHQDYYVKNPLRYQYYRKACRRDKTIKRLWGQVASKQHH